MEDFPLLTSIMILPLVGALFIFLFIKQNDKDIVKSSVYSGVWVSVSTFLVSLFLLFQFDLANSGFQFVEKYRWVESYNIDYHIGLDGISLFMILLTTFLTPICILISRNTVKSRIKEYVISFLLLESFVIGVFCALDILLFYLFFEIMLIPMFLIIGIWGGENRVYASFKFFLYTLAGSVLALLAIIYIYNVASTTDITKLSIILPEILSLEVQRILWLAFFAAFAVKIPMWPVHTWLPDAHVQAPTAGSVILAGVLLKVGGYGLLRYSIPLFPDASLYFVDFIYILSIIAIIYTSIVALAQKDMKKLIAYSSIAHMGFVTIGIFSFNVEGVAGAIFQMISHGFVSAALFLCVGVLYDRIHSRNIDDYGGIAKYMPIYATLFMVFTMASIGLPGTSGFVGEFLVILGVFKENMIAAALVATGVILGAVYMLFLYKRVVFGEVTNEKLSEIQDLKRNEMLVLIPIMLIVIIIGIYPKVILDYLAPAINNLLAIFSY